jgi:hypothetical protein
MREALRIDPQNKTSAKHSRLKVQGDYVKHLDVVDFDVEGYWSYGKRKGEEPPIRCYAEYSAINKDVILKSFPGQSKEIIDFLTHARKGFCQVVGNLYEDDALYQQLRSAEAAAGIHRS